MEAPAAGSAANVTDDDHPDDSDEWGGDEDEQEMFSYVGVKDSSSEKKL